MDCRHSGYSWCCCLQSGCLHSGCLHSGMEDNKEKWYEKRFTERECVETDDVVCSVHTVDQEGLLLQKVLWVPPSAKMKHMEFF